MKSKTKMVGNQITLGGGTYEISNDFRTKGELKYSQVTITKIAPAFYCIPKFTLLERFKFLFTNRLKKVKIYDNNEYINLGEKND